MPKGRSLSRPPWRSWRAARTEACDDHMMQTSRRKGENRRGSHGEGAGVADRDRGRRRRAGDEADVGDIGVLPRASRKKTSLRRRSAASRHALVDEEVDDDEVQLTDTEVGLGDGRRRPN